MDKTNSNIVAVKASALGEMSAIQAVRSLCASDPNDDGEYCTNVQSDRDGELWIISRLLGSPDVEHEEMVQEGLVCMWWLVHWIDVIDQETGELLRRPALSVMSADGRVWGSASPHVLRTFMIVLTFRPDRPWSPPIRLGLRRPVGKSGRTRHEIEVRKDGAA